MCVHVCCVCVAICIVRVYEQSGGRKIQTVGTPWQGTPVMQQIADLTQLFGFGCGYNEDLSLQGASRWLNKIPVETQKEVYYYTTAGDVSYSITNY